MRNRITSILTVLILVLTVGVAGLKAAKAQTYIPLAQLQSGDLIRGQTFPAVYYYGKDGFRYVFPNFNTYKTWYGEDFSTVKWLTDADLGKIQIGGNVTYRPGVKMIKINSDPKTYAVGKDGELRWVSTEAVAVAMYGSNWNTKIDDMPDGFFGNYKKGDDIVAASDFSPSSETAAIATINADKDLESATYVSATDSGFQPQTVTISAGRVIKWTNNGTVKHTVTADDLKWGSGTMDLGVSFQRRFDSVGTYTYFDSYNSNLTGTVVIVQ